MWCNLNHNFVPIRIDFAELAELSFELENNSKEFYGKLVGRYIIL
jgi:hypothetical protein